LSELGREHAKRVISMVTQSRSQAMVGGAHRDSGDRSGPARPTRTVNSVADLAWNIAASESS
jgi:hypothetical protein